MANIILTPNGDNYTATAAGDIIEGRGGDDTLKSAAGGDGLYGGDGNDILNGGAGNDTLLGDDQLNPNAQNVMNGFSGDDLIISYSGHDEINAGAGKDIVRVYAQMSGQVVNGGLGIDDLEIRSLSGISQAVRFTLGQTSTFTVGGVASASYVNFESLDIIVGTGAAFINAGSRDDKILFAYDANNSNNIAQFDAGTIRAYGGNDTIAFNGIAASGTGVEKIYGGNGGDSLNWTPGKAVITDLAINAGTGTMTADGHLFARFYGIESVQFFSFPTISGTLDYKGMAGSDAFNIGAATSSRISTFAGDDVIRVSGGPATVYGGAGDDIVQGGPTAETPTLIFHGGDGDDMLIGGSGVGMLFGETGNDSITSHNTHSQVFGGRGDDSIFLDYHNASTAGGSGAGLIDGGAGAHDKLMLTFADAGSLTLDFSHDLTLPDGTRITGIEAVDLQSGAGNDNLTASNGTLGAVENLLNGGAGNDTLQASSHGAALSGGVGVDLLIGDGAADLLNGGYGADTLHGGAGNDSLVGANGRDFETGGLGADQFILNSYKDSGTKAATRDHILDFSILEGDKLDLSNVDANRTASAHGDQAFTYLGHTAFSHVAGELQSHLVNRAGTSHDATIVTGDINGDGVADFSVQLAGLINLHDTDFIL